MREQETAYLAEIIERVNDLFSGDLTDGDKLVYVNDVIKGKRQKLLSSGSCSKPNSLEGEPVRLAFFLFFPTRRRKMSPAGFNNLATTCRLEVVLAVRLDFSDLLAGPAFAEI